MAVSPDLALLFNESDVEGAPVGCDDIVIVELDTWTNSTDATLPSFCVCWADVTG
jgi:hypothetical protein